MYQRSAMSVARERRLQKSDYKPTSLNYKEEADAHRIYLGNANIARYTLYTSAELEYGQQARLHCSTNPKAAK